MYNQIFHTYRHDAREQEIRQGHKGLRPIDENLSYTRETSTRVGRRNEERKRVHHIQWWEGEYTKKLHGARFRYLLNDFFLEDVLVLPLCFPRSQTLDEPPNSMVSVHSLLHVMSKLLYMSI